jgi:hypothetical protein
VEDLHRRIIRVGLDALAQDYGYALAGGYAVQVHEIVNRMSDDVDLFAPIERAEREMPAAVERVTVAYEAAGFLVEVAQQVTTYTRLCNPIWAQYSTGTTSPPARPVRSSAGPRFAMPSTSMACWTVDTPPSA